MKVLLIAMLAILILSRTAYAEHHDVYGIFITDEGSAKIQIKECSGESVLGYETGLCVSDMFRIKLFLGPKTIKVNFDCQVPFKCTKGQLDSHHPK